MKKSKAFSLIELAVVGLIISILMAGIMGSSALKKKAVLANARTQTNNSPVASIGDLVLWYETTSEKSFSTDETADGSTISTWYDLNPNIETVRNNATQTIPGNRPTYKTNKINGLPAVSFTRANSNYLSFDGSGIVNNNFTIFIVEQRTSNVSSNYFMGGSESTLNTNLILGYRIDTTITLSYANNGMDYTLVPAYSAPTAKIISYTFNFVNKKIYINGAAQTPFAHIASGAEADATTSFAGAMLGGTSNTPSYYQGNIGEVIIFKKYLNSEDRKSVEKYLGKKWGITVGAD